MGEPLGADAPAQARVMSIYKQYLDLIASGAKTIEVRVGYPSMRRIAPGQRIRFVSGDQECLRRVMRVSEYSSFERCCGDRRCRHPRGAAGRHPQDLPAGEGRPRGARHRGPTRAFRGAVHYERDRYRSLRREFLWRFSKAELTQVDLEWAAERPHVLARQSAERMHKSLRYAWPEFVANTRVLADRFPRLQSLAEAIEQYSTVHERAGVAAAAAQDELLAALTRDAVPFMALKGAAMRAYASGASGGNDLDILVPDLDSAWEAIGVAESLGYILTRMKLGLLAADQVAHCKGASPPNVWGNGNLYRSDLRDRAPIQGDWDLGRVRTLDLHVTTFPGAGECMLIAPLWERSTVGEISAAAVRIPSPEDIVLIELAHLMRHGTLTIRGVNRIAHVLATSGEAFDRCYASEQISRNGLALIGHAVLLTIAQGFEAAHPWAEALRGSIGRLPPWAASIADRVSTLRRVEKYGALTPSCMAMVFAYLRCAGRVQLGVRGGLSNALAGAGRMLANYPVNPRAHPRWSERRLGWLSKDMPGIMLCRLDRMPWPQDGSSKPHSELETAGLKPIGKRCMLVSQGRADEVLLTPVGAFTSAPYEGDVPHETRERCLVAAMGARGHLAES